MKSLYLVQLFTALNFPESRIVWARSKQEAGDIAKADVQDKSNFPDNFLTVHSVRVFAALGNPEPEE